MCRSPRLDLLDQVLTGHFLGLRQTHDGQTSRRDVGETSLFAVDLVFTLAARDDEGNRVGRVRGVRCASVRVDHLLGVAVVGGDGEDVAGFLTGVVDGSHGLVGGGDSLDGGVKVTSVTDLFKGISTWRRTGEAPTCHIGGRKVAHDKLVFPTLDDLCNLVGDAMGVHLGLLVVRRDLGRRNHFPVFVLELLFDTSVEEEGDVGVLFGFCRSRRRSDVRSTLEYGGRYLPAT